MKTNLEKKATEIFNSPKQLNKETDAKIKTKPTTKSIPRNNTKESTEINCITKPIEVVDATNTDKDKPKIFRFAVLDNEGPRKKSTK